MPLQCSCFNNSFLCRFDGMSSEPRVSICTSWSKNRIYEETNTTPKRKLKKHFSLKHFFNKTYLSYSAFAHQVYRKGFAETTAQTAGLFSTMRIHFTVPWFWRRRENPYFKTKTRTITLFTPSLCLSRSQNITEDIQMNSQLGIPIQLKLTLLLTI